MYWYVELFLVRLRWYLAYHEINPVLHPSPETLNIYMKERERETLAENQTALGHFMMGGQSYRFASSATSGSTPITFMLGLSALMTVLTPPIRLPPPTGTTTTGAGYCNNLCHTRASLRHMYNADLHFNP